jgi:hypothetical protein
MHPLARFACAALLAWQAVAAALAHGERAVAIAGGDCVALATETTADRVGRVFGADMPIFLELPHLVPEGAVLLNRRIVSSLEEVRAKVKSEQELIETVQRLAARNGLFLQLAALLFPRPVLHSVPDPIALAEVEAGPGDDRWLFVYQGDVEPTDRKGWSCTHRAATYSIWRFQKGF